MSTYVMGDIHGCYDDFKKMLQNIGFGEKDQLILSGDYIDRGVQNLRVLRWMENAPENVLFIKGNHDIEFAQCIKIVQIFVDRLSIDITSSTDLFRIYSVIKEEYRSDKFDYYGTLRQLIVEHKVTCSDLAAWQKIIDDMPFYFKQTINKQKYIIVHAGYITKKGFDQISGQYEDIESFYLYAREDAIKYGGEKDTTIIFGHTPTIMPGIYYNDGNVFLYHDKKKNCTFYNIDCGKTYFSEKYPNAKLSCIRLEDRKIFYV